MPEINLSNKAGRDAVVTMESVFSPLKVRWIDARGRQASTIRVLKSSIDLDLDALLEQFSDLQQLGARLIEDDPEINLETCGSFLHATSRVYINPDRKIVHRVQQYELIKNPDGSLRERRERERLPQNVSADIPLKWTGKMIDKQEAARKFIFSNKVQIIHINGLTYDFLFAMARELEERHCMMLLGAGPRSNQPLVLRRGTTPYRGFLEGRTRKDRYILLLHLSNLELKVPSASDEA